MCAFLNADSVPLASAASVGLVEPRARRAGTPSTRPARAAGSRGCPAESFRTARRSRGAVSTRSGPAGSRAHPAATSACVKVPPGWRSTAVISTQLAGSAMMSAYARADAGATPYFKSWFASRHSASLAGDTRQRFDVGRGRGAEHRRHHARQTDLRGDALQHQHVPVTRGNDMSIPLAAHHEADHLAADIAPPPPAFERPVGPAEGVDHRRDLGVGFAEDVQHALGGQVARHLFPHDVAQFRLREC